MKLNIKNIILHFIGLLLLISITHGASLKNDFLIDDVSLITTNRTTQNLKHIVDGFLLKDHQNKKNVGHYRPVSKIFRTLTFQAFGNNPIGYHA
ncbi:MAG: hypothetical protein ACI9E5_001139, partial [Candidatus Omnitrophota bacterium]